MNEPSAASHVARFSVVVPSLTTGAPVKGVAAAPVTAPITGPEVAALP